MKKIKYIGLVLVAMLMAPTLLIGCATGPTEELPPIKIGILAPFSGMGEYVSGLLENSVRAKLDEIGWEIAGRKIELITEDTAGDPVVGVDKARKLVEVDKVDVVLGPLYSHVAMAVADYLATTGTPLIAYSQHPKAMVMMGGNAFLPFGTIAASSVLLGSYAYDKLGYRTATLMFDDYAGGEGYMVGFTEVFKASGGTIVQTQRTPLGTFDYSPYITTIEDADVMAIWFIPPEAPSFYKQYTEYGKKMPILYTYLGTMLEEYLAQIGDSSIGSLGQGFYSPLLDNDLNKRFVQYMEERLGLAPSAYEYGIYVATTLFLEAVEATKGDTTPEKIINALKQVKVDTPGGKVSFTNERVGIGDQYILKVVKIEGKYMLEVLETNSQVVLKAPSE